MSRYGMIAGNGRFPLLALETARAAGDEVVVLAIKKKRRRKWSNSPNAVIGFRSASFRA